MKFIQNLIVKTSEVAILLVLPITSMGGNSGTITFAPANASAIPTLSTSMLIVLSLLLVIVAFRIKRKDSRKLFIALIGSSALMAGGSGFKLVSDLEAGGPTTLSMPQGGTQPVLENAPNAYINRSGVTLEVVDIAPPAVCNNFPNGINLFSQECSVGLRLTSTGSMDRIGPNSPTICFVDCRSPNTTED